MRAKEWGEQSGAQSIEALQEALFSRFSGFYRFPRLYVPRWTGVGGTVTTIAALSRSMAVYDRTVMQEIVLSQADVEGKPTRFTPRGTPRAPSIRCSGTGTT